MRVLVVEDDPALAREIRRGIEEYGIAVDHVVTGDDAVAAVRGTPFDVIVLDVMLPGSMDGFEACRVIRSHRVGVPVLMLTALDAVADRVSGLEAGADDYLVKPFAFEELLARIRALARRRLDDRGAVLRAGNVALDTRAHAVHVGGRPLQLTTKEHSILELMLLHAGQVLSKEQIHDHTWNYDYAGDSNLVEIYVSRLRRKLEAAGADHRITTLRGTGYRLDAVADAAAFADAGG